MSQSAPAQALSESYVFVYGTLRRSGSNDINLRKPAPRFVGTSSLSGTLFDLGPYPGLTVNLAGDDSSDGLVLAVRVMGEVYAISPALEDNLDELEGLLPVPTGEYVKRFLPLQVHLAGNGTGTPTASLVPQELLCIVYEINPTRTEGCARVSSGDWIAHAVEKQAQQP